MGKSHRELVFILLFLVATVLVFDVAKGQLTGNVVSSNFGDRRPLLHTLDPAIVHTPEDTIVILTGTNLDPAGGIYINELPYVYGRVNSERVAEFYVPENTPPSIYRIQVVNTNKQMSNVLLLTVQEKREEILLAKDTLQPGVIIQKTEEVFAEASQDAVVTNFNMDAMRTGVILQGDEKALEEASEDVVINRLDAVLRRLINEL